MKRKIKFQVQFSSFSFTINCSLLGAESRTETHFYKESFWRVSDCCRYWKVWTFLRCRIYQYLVILCSNTVNWSRRGGSWLVHPSPDREIWVRALAGDIVLCSWARHFTEQCECLSTPRYVNGKRVPNIILWVTLRWTSILSRGE